MTDKLKHRIPSTPLTEAAAALSEELAAFEEITERVKRSPLSSQRTLAKAAEEISEGADAQARFGEVLRKLVDAVAAARDRHQANLEALNERSALVSEKIAAFKDLQGRFAKLGEEAHTINALVMDAATKRQGPDGEHAPVSDQLTEARSRMLGVRDQASELFQVARDGGFADLAHQADSLRQQLTSATEKVELVLTSLTQGAA